MSKASDLEVVRRRNKEKTNKAFRTLTLEEILRVEKFPRHFIMTLKEGEKKRDLYPFRLEEELGSVKVIIYLQRDEVQDLQSFSEGMKREYNVTEISSAPWIILAIAAMRHLSSVQGDTLPTHIRIAGKPQLISI